MIRSLPVPVPLSDPRPAHGFIFHVDARNRVTDPEEIREFLRVHCDRRAVREALR